MSAVLDRINGVACALALAFCAAGMAAGWF